LQGFIRGEEAVHTNFALSLIVACCFAGCATFQAGTEFQAGRTALITGKPEIAAGHFERISASDASYVNDSIPLREGIWTYLGRAYYEVGKLAEAEGALKKALNQNANDFMARLYLGLVTLRQANVPISKKSFTLQDIRYALKEGVASSRVTVLVKERGVNFNLTEDAEKELRISGADDELLRQIRTIAEQKKRTEQKSKQESLREIGKALADMRSSLQYILEGPQGRFWDPQNKIRSQINASLAMINDKKTEDPTFVSGLEWLGKALEEEADLARRDEREELRRRDRR
jgi:tetratricopeptide (TPR) repeat protein